MTDKPARAPNSAAWAMVAYALTIALALGFDLLVDQSFGAVMLAVLPISLIALLCLVLGPWQEGERKFTALKAWFVGASLILVVSIGFSSLGADQAKAGELVFTYAAMTMALPSSLILPIAATWLEPLLGDSVVIRIVGMWIICTAAGGLQWKALGWLYSSVRRRVHGRVTDMS